MVDDLTLQGVTEPYRMLTARAEYRLRLRADNAATRLTPLAERAGCLSPGRRRAVEQSVFERARINALLSAKHGAAAIRDAGMDVRDDGVKRSLADWIRFPEVDAEGLIRLVPELAETRRRELDEVVQDWRYAPYVQRQQSEIARLRADDSVLIPVHFDYGTVPGLSNEMVERLSLARPTSLGAAGRIRGITPAALAAILVHVRRKAA